MAFGHIKFILLALLLGFIPSLEGNKNDASALCGRQVEKLTSMVQMVSEKTLRGGRSGEKWSCDSVMRNMINVLKTVLKTLINLQKQKLIDISNRNENTPCNSKLIDLIHSLRKIPNELKELQNQLPRGNRNDADTSCSSNIEKLIGVLRIVSKAARKLQKIIHKNECDAGWTEYRGLCFLVKNTKVVYDDAVEICRSHSATVAAPTDVQSNEFIRSLYARNEDRRYWLGIRKIGDTWRLPDGTAVEFKFWREQEPDGCCSNNVTCAMVGDQDDIGAWEDVGCRDRRLAVMCQHAKKRTVAE